jgi:hypothetical protein
MRSLPAWSVLVKQVYSLDPQVFERILRDLFNLFSSAIQAYAGKRSLDKIVPSLDLVGDHLY